jgi:hypothetical protein
MIIVKTKRLISLMTIVTLLASVLLPSVVHAHLCAGSAAVARSLERNDHHHDDAVADEHDHHAAGHHDHGDHHVAEPAEAVHSHGSGHVSEMSYCCYEGDASQQRVVESAVLPSRLVLAHAITLLHVATPSFLLHLSESAQGDFKIGSSPPFLAPLSHSTYLRISVLLI